VNISVTGRRVNEMVVNLCDGFVNTERRIEELGRCPATPKAAPGVQVLCRRLCLVGFIAWHQEGIQYAD
jgi:hypothetical protein